VAALGANPIAVALAVMLLGAGTLVFWRRPDEAAARAYLAGTSLLPCALTAAPWGVGPIDLAGGRGAWPHGAGEALGAAGLGSLLLAVLCMSAAGPLRGRLAVVAAYAVPVVSYLVWLAVALAQHAPGLSRTHAVASVLTPALLACLPAVLVAALLAHRRATEREEMLATRLVLLGVGCGVVGWAVLEVLPRVVARDPAIPGSVLTILLVPILLGSLGIAVSRYRLSEIEPAVRRTLVQAVVLVLAGAAFVGLVRAVDVASDIAVGSMLVGGLAALLLLPAAVALQRWVRRQVYGDREMPRRVVSDLRRLDPLAAPEAVLQETLDLLARRLHLSYAAIEVAATDASEPIETSVGRARATPVTVDLAVGGSTLGSLHLEVDPAHDPFGPGDRQLLEDVGTQVGALVQAVSINRELQRSRQHLISAREEERRRIRRDLHDGLGPSLASLAMQLEAAQDLIVADPTGARVLVGRLSDKARDEIGEVRRLVEGLRPPALDQLGLVSALRQRAEDHNQGGRAGGTPPKMTWTVDAADDLEPLPAAVEVAAYRIVLEAVNNATRHSGARRCTVSLARDGSSLRVRVGDDGEGLAPDHASGVGLFTMRERAEELGGTCTVTAGLRGDGTMVEAVLPITVDDGEG
jgi:signal transduction histidine kinase